VNVKGIVVAGPADLKRELVENDFLEPRIKKAIITTLDTGLGGFDEAVEQAGAILNIFEELSRSTNMAVCGAENVMKMLEYSCAETVVVWELLTLRRLVFQNKLEDQVIRYGYMQDQRDDGELKYKSSQLLVEFLAEKCEESNVELRIVSDQTSEGQELRQGFGDVGALLRYPVSAEDLVMDQPNLNKRQDGDLDDTDTTGTWEPRES